MGEERKKGDCNRVISEKLLTKGESPTQKEEEKEDTSGFVSSAKDGKWGGL